MYRFSHLSIENIQASIDTQNGPIVVQQAVEKYLKFGYSKLEKVFTPDQLDLVYREWNYHTTSKGIDLNNAGTLAREKSW